MNEHYNAAEIMRTYGIRPAKSLGQNFLNSPEVVENIVDVAELTEADAIIEIGPGLGVMTRRLAERAGLVVAVEIDRSLMPVLKALEAEFDNLVVINGDILKINVGTELIESIIRARGFDTVKVVANLPYYITTPIIMELLENYAADIKKMVFMVQKEVAERMVAGPGGKDYGAMSVTVGYFAEGDIAFTVPPHCFTPRPGVDSAVVSLDMREKPPFELADKEFFFKIIKASFLQRRKMLVNGLANAAFLSVDKETAARTLEEMGKAATIRGETLSPEEFAELSNRLYNTIK